MMIAEGMVKVKMVNQVTGDYRAQLIDSEGKVLSTQTISHDAATVSETINFGRSLTGGMYKIVITKPDHSTTTEKIMLLL